MRIGLLPPLDTTSSATSLPAETPGLRPRPAATVPVRFIETYATLFEINGGSHVDLDYQ